MFLPSHCTNSDCYFHQNPGGTFIRKGHFRVKRTQKIYRRFQCSRCKKTLSSRSFAIDRWHKKPDLNLTLLKNLTSSMSLRACARNIGMTKNNTYKKFLWFGALAQSIKKNLLMQAEVLFFDEMQTFEHTKCKPLSVALMVNEKYEILDIQVAEMPSTGKLAEISLRKYGPRNDHREEALQKLFQNIKSALTTAPVLIKSDGHPSYPKFVKQYFPEIKYEQHSRSEKERHRDRLHESHTKREYDPMFELNQRCAKIRSDIKRLARRTWCTTKRWVNLQRHLDLMMVAQHMGWIQVTNSYWKVV